MAASGIAGCRDHRRARHAASHRALPAGRADAHMGCVGATSHRLASDSPASGVLLLRRRRRRPSARDPEALRSGHTARRGLSRPAHHPGPTGRIHMPAVIAGTGLDDWMRPRSSRSGGRPGVGVSSGHCPRMTGLLQRGGDDVALKVCALFDMARTAVPFPERQRVRLARMRSGESLPTATPCDAWVPSGPLGTVVPNAQGLRGRAAAGAHRAVRGVAGGLCVGPERLRPRSRGSSPGGSGLRCRRVAGRGAAGRS